MAIVISDHAEIFVAALNERFSNYGVFSANPGKRFDKIVVKPKGSIQTLVHAFVEASTGHVYKAQGWNSPAKGVRYATVEAAMAKADPFGSYLYKR